MQILHSCLGGAQRPCAPRECQRCLGHQKLHRHARYQRSAQCAGSEKVWVQRYQCPRCRRTFSVLPEGMFPYRSLPVVRFELWMDWRFELGSPAAAADGGPRPPPASEVEKGCLLRALNRLQSRIPLLCGLLGQQMPVIEPQDIRGFWQALRHIGRLGRSLRFLAESFKRSLLGDYLCLDPPWLRGSAPGRPRRAPA